ncbi:MAG: 3-oxoacyl-ACP synthase [Desulfobacteraceae bacterium]|nr:MAG: 3-oxoacyl-ACP synthase [Desulfobacteraceae bacterium]
MKARTFITGIGMITPVGTGVHEIAAFIRTGNKEIRPLRLFPSQTILPTGEICLPFPDDDIPRTHRLAIIAARDALKSSRGAVDAIVMGTSTGGMSLTEVLLKDNETDPQKYQYHAAGSVAEYIAGQTACNGPVITISTACSSGTAALAIALELIRSGRAKKVLAVAADALCRFTYFGFHSLQLIDPDGARPFDQDRKGMTVAEGAAALLLESSENIPENACAEILGAGLSCDAYHPTAPHPEGKGAYHAMRRAIEDAALSPSDIDYINLHGTGTRDNDLSEATAVNRMFGNKKPFLSSIKGAMGHPLAAAGVIEVAVSAICIRDGRIPANTGCTRPDPKLALMPVMKPMKHPVKTVLSNSFGFGGNNASVVIGPADENNNSASPAPKDSLKVIGCECLTGAGRTDATLSRFLNGKSCKGIFPMAALSENLPPKLVRRLKRLPRMALSLASSLQKNTDSFCPPSSIFWGTGWGALSETYDFLSKLFESGGQFCSPTDFIGSVHNAAAGQVAMLFQSKGANITTTGGDYSFEQALLSADLLHPAGPDESVLVMGADEHHEKLSHLFDDSVSRVPEHSDGGGALLLKRADAAGGLTISSRFYERADQHPDIIPALIKGLGGPERIDRRFGAVLVGIPAAHRKIGEDQLREFLSRTGFNLPVIDYRQYSGEYASASATAAVFGIRLLQSGRIPAPLAGENDILLQGKGILLIGTGTFVTAIELLPS